jgi:hypothetical protein
LLIVTWGDAQVSRPRLGARKRVVGNPDITPVLG